MPYVRQPFPGNLDTVDLLRRSTEEEFERLEQAYAEDEKIETDRFDAIEAAIAQELIDRAAADTALDARLDKLEGNQFARVERVTTAQTGLTASVPFKIQFNNVRFDLSSIWDAANFRFKPTVAGYYRISWAAQMTYTAGSYAFTSAYINGAVYANGSVSDDAPTFQNSVGSSIAHFNGTTDYAEIFGTIASGGSLSLTAGSTQTYFEISLVKAD